MPCLELVRHHVPQALIVHRANVDVGSELLPCHTADQALACTAALQCHDQTHQA